ncbi:DUF1223 domain-containing protein [Marinovum sp. 2_MG-2023]|uniref:DUF1223 domain-containing protein n=1 Tax=unclassified Marinovum TaxID=2647166 RepID=UPI0026E3045F|nr:MULTISPECIES: DUF1223 domain-containing protein [unclassified Marinovum]MDO6731057.1 DUF1223 domain-containing protein [Marinovum sp. 2_MG-2023]MDO6778554.1 DUF1223 domain-containing protein [Marinovum sp. 1_MG-2023]
MTLRNVLGALAFAGLAGVMPMAGAWADETGARTPAVAAPVVVELFTSQGCSSCPPADALLHKLAARSDVIALALHVDYWDYIGWKDEFALAGHTNRQKGYASVAGRRMIYTPQMIINGTDHVVGNHPMDVNELIKLHQAAPSQIRLDISDTASGTQVTARAVADLDGGLDGGMRIVLVEFSPNATTTITRGENAGRTISYANIVQNWRELGQWDGESDFQIAVEAEGAAAVLVQKADFGPILAAAKLP